MNIEYQIKYIVCNIPVITLLNRYPIRQKLCSSENKNDLNHYAQPSNSSIFSINHSNIEIGGERADDSKDFGLDIHCYL